MKEKLVSIIIPTYKRPDRLSRAVNSLLKQTYSHFEILVVNDDNDNITFEGLLNDISDQRVKLLNNERVKGANGARNTGILKAKGDYITFLDDDDEFEPNNLKTQLQKIQNSNSKVGYVYGGYLYETKNNWKPVMVKKEGKILGDFIAGRFSFGSGSNGLFKKEVFTTVGLWDEELLRQQDLELMVRVLEAYEVAFNDNLILKVYGHNEPNPLKAFKAREKFIVKVSSFLEKILKSDKKEFYSNHYRRQTIFLFKLKEFGKAFDYWKKARRYKTFSLKKDVKIIFSLFNSFIKR